MTGQTYGQTEEDDDGTDYETDGRTEDDDDDDDGTDTTGRTRRTDGRSMYFKSFKYNIGTNTLT